MAKGDFVKVEHTVDAAQEGLRVHALQTSLVAADKAGRQVSGSFTTEGKLNWYKIELQSRSGKVIESTQVPVESIVSIVVHRKDE